MPNRYSFHIPRPDLDRPTMAENVGRGISAAIEGYLSGKQQRREEVEADRQEANQYTTQGFEAVPPMAGRTPTPTRRGAGIGERIGAVLNDASGSVFPAANQGYDIARTRGGQTFRRPGAQMRQQQDDARELALYGQKEDIRASREIAVANARNAGRPTHEQRMDIERERTARAERIARLNGQFRAAVAATTSGRATGTSQLNALRTLQASYDREAAEINDKIVAAGRAYAPDEEIADLRRELAEVASKSEEVRAAIAGLVPSAGLRGPQHAPEDPRSAAARRQRPRQAPRTGHTRPPASTSLPLTPAPSSRGRRVPPPVRP